MYTAAPTRALVVTAVIVALSLAGGARAPIVFAGVPVTEHPLVRPNEDFRGPDPGCGPEQYPGSGHCGSGNTLLDYLWIVGAGGLLVVLVKRLRD